MINWLGFGMRCLLHVLVVVCASALPMAVGAQSHNQSLREQLRSLAATEGFTVEGLGFIGDEQTPRALGNDVVGRLRALLHDYDYVVAYDAESRVTEIRVLGLRQPPTKAPEGVAVVVTRKGSQHLVEATLVGPTGAWRKLPLIVDTGATNVVLPRSMASELGFGDADLSEGSAETAGGRVKARAGWLASVSVGQAKVQDVAVTFIDDAQIGDKALLGMSFLNHFRLTIEKSGDRIILMTR